MFEAIEKINSPNKTRSKFITELNNDYVKLSTLVALAEILAPSYRQEIYIQDEDHLKSLISAISYNDK